MLEYFVYIILLQYLFEVTLCKITCNEYKFGFKIEACSTPIARDLLMSLAGQQAQHSTRCIEFVLLH
jgi:hypothetical protein